MAQACSRSLAASNTFCYLENLERVSKLLFGW